jgi:hypothetical protein
MTPSCFSWSLAPTALLSFSGWLAAQSTPASPPAAAPEQKPEAKAEKAESKAAAKADEPKPWRLAPALGLNDWFKVSGSQRVRYETLDNQFRFRNPNNNPPGQGFGDAEDDLALQTLVLLEAKGDGISGALEILDARQYGIDATGFADTTLVDTFDALQAYVDLSLGELGGGKHRLRLGRETVDLGGRRVMARNQYRNTINAFTGVDWLWTGDGQSLRAFWVLPVDRRPNDFASIRNNEWEEDDQDLDLQFAGVFYSKSLDERTTVETYVLGLDERGANTRRRELLTPGVRLFQPRKKGLTNFEIELIGQVGESKTSTATNQPLRDHVAGYARLALGYTADMAWQPTVELSWDYASGDQDPNDSENNRFDTLFGARRWDYGPTGVFGAVARANLNSPEVKVVLKTSSTTELTFGVRGVWLASERDTWTTAGLRDSSGRSGDNVGQQYEVRFRWDFVPRSVNFDIAAVYLAEGSFQDRASGNQGRDVTTAYAQCVWTF